MLLPGAHRRPRPRAARAVAASLAAAGLAAALALLAGCRPLARPQPARPLAGAPAAVPLGPSNDAAFEALRAALAAGEDARATQLVAGLRARSLGPREREL